MNKDSFLSDLENRLSELSYRERRDILFDYEEHFNECLKQGMSEEEIISILDSPEKIAAFYLNINSEDMPTDPNLETTTASVIDNLTSDTSEIADSTKSMFQEPDISASNPTSNDATISSIEPSLTNNQENSCLVHNKTVTKCNPKV